jgi:PAS domain S-box-containing protein
MEINWKQIFDAISDLALILDLDHRIISANPAVEKMIKLKKEKIVGRKCYDIFHCQDHPPIGCPHQKLISNRNPETIEMEMESLGKNYLVTVAPIFDASGNLIQSIHLAKDITALKHTEHISNLKNRALKALSECNQVVVRAKGTTDLLNDICRVMVEVAGYRLAWIGYALDDERKTVKPMASYGDDQDYVRTVDIVWSGAEKGRGPTGAAIRTGTPFICRNIQTDPIFKPWASDAVKRGYASSIALPLIDKDKCIGAVNLYSTRPDAFDADEVNLLSDMANNISYGIAAQNAQARLSLSEEKYRLHFKHVTDVIYSIDPEFKVLTVSPSVESLLGYTPEELIGRPFHELNVLAPEYFEKAFSDIMKVLSGETISSTLYEFISKDQSRKFGEVSGAPMILDNKVAAVVSVARDVTERKRAEKIIKQESLFSDLLINSLPGIFYLFDEKGKFLRWNKNFEDISEYSPLEIARMTPMDFFAGDGKEHIVDRIQKVFINGRGDAEADFVSKSGKRTPFYFTGLLIHIDNKPHLSGMGIDISERKISEEALNRSREQYREVVENANDAIIILQDGLIVFHNQRAETLTGYTGEELARTPFIEFVNPDDRKTLLERYAQKLNGEKFGAAYAFGIMHKQGHELWVEVNTAVVSWKKKPAIQCFIRDVTLQKKLESQLRQAHKLESIGTLAGGIAHDFNNIIGIILGNTELAMYDVPDWSPARKNLETVCNACFRARDVVRQILSFSRQTEQEKRPVLLSTIIKESLKLLRSSIPASIDIQVNFPDLPHTILADPVQIHQVIINLCTNAVHAMKEKGGVIEVNLTEIALDKISAQQHSGLSPGQYLELSVRDSGQGIDPKILSRIFDPYFTTKKIGEGSGMGLAVVHGIVKNHGGVISVSSQPEKGSAFKILFPKVEADHASEKETPEEVPRGKEKILYVDDETALAEIGKQMLEYLGYRVESKTNPLDALELFKVDPYLFDLVVTDMAMPLMTGKALAKELMNIRPDIPIILTSGYSDQIDEGKAAELGIQAYVMKPLNTTHLAKTIRDALDKNGK